MIEKNNIQKQIEEYSLDVIGTPVADIDNNNKYYIFISTKIADGKETPSTRTLRNISAKLEAKDIFVEFISISPLQRDVETSIRSTIMCAFPNKIREIYLSAGNKGVAAWLIPTAPIDDNLYNEIKNKLELLVEKIFSLSLTSIWLQERDSTPSKLACLRAVRKSAPATPAKVAADLRQRGFTVPSDDWMATRLDSLRKAALIIRLKSGKYALTLTGLRALGTSKNAHSPDIARMLDLARRTA